MMRIEVAKKFAEPFLLPVIYFVGQGGLRRGYLGAADFHHSREDLGVVAAPHAIGEAGVRFLGAFQSGVAQDVEDLVVGEVLGCGAGVAPDNGQAVVADRRDQHQFLAAFDLNLVADAEAASVVHVELRVGAGVAPGGVVDRVFVREQFVFEPFVVHAGRGP